MPGDSSRTIGFVILSHANPKQVLRLIKTLNAMYHDPPIAWHHDLSQSEIETNDLPPNVWMVMPSLKTGWGKWSVVQSFLAALELLYRKGNPEWFCLLSGSDYPASRAEMVIDELKHANCDAFLDVHQVEKVPPAARLVGNWNPALSHLETAEQYDQKNRFYNRAQLCVPVIRTQPNIRLGRLTFQLPFRGLSPYRHDYGLFWGDHWFTANRKAAEALLSPSKKHHKLRRYLRWRSFPEETYYQTVMCNTAGLIICRDNKRFVRWNGGGAHPVTLEESNVSEILASGAHFARKFTPDSPALDVLDRFLLGKTES